MKLVPNDDFGDLIDSKDWAVYVKAGAFIPYDGSGYWATADEHSCDHDAFGPRPDWATHVLWFNK